MTQLSMRDLLDSEPRRNRRQDMSLHRLPCCRLDRKHYHSRNKRTQKRASGKTSTVLLAASMATPQGLAAVNREPSTLYIQEFICQYKFPSAGTVAIKEEPTVHTPFQLTNKCAISERQNRQETL